MKNQQNTGWNKSPATIGENPMVCEGQTQMTGAGAMDGLLPTSATPVARLSQYLRSEKQGANESVIIDDPIIDHITFYYSSDFTLFSSIFTPLLPLPLLTYSSP